MTYKDIVERLRDSECCQAMGGVGCHPPRCAECPRTAADLIEALRTQRDKAVAALRKYGRHERRCFELKSTFDLRGRERTCTCGFTAALARLETK